MMDLSFWLPFMNCIKLHIKFQSLLWWICLFDWTMQQMKELTLPCFNPCYDGFVFLTEWVVVCAEYFVSVSILVMMDLSFWRRGSFWPICQSIVSILVMMDLSFWRRGSFWPICQSIVSILVMMDLSFWLLPVTVPVPLTVFQSLLWWICLFDEDLFGLKIAEPMQFQSLLWWICLFDPFQSDRWS